MDILLLTTPAQHSASNPDVELNPRRLKRWISELHIMDVPHTVKQLADAIEPLNSLELDDIARLKLLEIYNIAFEEILFFYDEIRLGQISGSSINRSTIAQDIMWLYLELANGYKIIIKNAQESGKSLLKNSSLLLACYRAMELITHAIVYAFRVHESAPHLAFLEVNQIYSLAERNGVLHEKLKAIKDKASIPTIDRLYKQFLLLVAADPFKLNGVEVLEMYVLLEPFASTCEIVTHFDSDSDNGVYLIDLMQDSQPKFIHTRLLNDPPPSARFFKIESAVHAIKSSLENISHQELSFSQEQKKKLLSLVLSQIGNSRSRTEERKRINKNLKVAFGSESVDYFLTDEEYIKDACALESIDGFEVSIVNDNKSHELTAWRMLDEGKRGCLIESREFVKDKHMLVGEVIILVDESSLTTRLSVWVGVVRWLRHNQHNVQKLGIEYLSHDPLPVNCVTSDNQNKHFGLYFPREEALQRPASLFISRKLKKSVTSLLIEAKGKTFAILPGDLLVETPLYSQFQIKVV